jgi:predicted ArsR family transcriptional regulator
MLTQHETLTFRSLKKSAIVLMLLIRAGNEAHNAKQIADILDMDYSTTRKHLDSLAALQLANETPVGWIASSSAYQLSASYPQVYPQADNKTVESARFSRALKDSSTTSAHTFLLEEEEEEEREEASKREKTASEETRIDEAIEELEERGVLVNNPVISLIERKDYITAAYISYHADRLEREKKYSSGLLLRVLKDGDPLPDPNAQERRKWRRQKEKYGDYIA